MWEDYIDCSAKNGTDVGGSNRTSLYDFQIRIRATEQQLHSSASTPAAATPTSLSSLVDNGQEDLDQDDLDYDDEDFDEIDRDTEHGLAAPGRGWFRCELCGKRARLPRAEHDDEESHMSLILPGLYVGGAWNACNARELRGGQIAVVVSMAAELPNKLFPNTIEYRHYPLEDDPREFIIPTLVHVSDFLSNKLEQPMALGNGNEANNTLVHCFQGRSRSVSAVMAYLIRQGGTAAHALAQIQEQRPFAQPNPGYMHQLHALEILCRALPFTVVDLIASFCPQKGLNL